jgi:hypothetical protein
METYHHVTFYTRKSRSNKSSESDIYLRVTVNSKRSDMSIGRKVDPRKWNVNSEKMMGRSQEAQELNNYMDVLKNKLKRIQQTLLEKDQRITATTLIRELKGIGKNKSKMTLEVFREHNEQMDRLSGKSISKSTAKRYWTCYNHIEQFLNEVYKAEDFRIG